MTMMAARATTKRISRKIKRVTRSTVYIKHLPTGNSDLPCQAHKPDEKPPDFQAWV
jgi:hypothetical protein